MLGFQIFATKPAPWTPPTGDINFVCVTHTVWLFVFSSNDPQQPWSPPLPLILSRGVKSCNRHTDRQSTLVSVYCVLKNI